jgi:hypothetical protein
VASDSRAVVPYGVSTLAVGWPGTVSLSISTLRRLIVEVVNGLASHGFRHSSDELSGGSDHLERSPPRAALAAPAMRVLVAGFEPGSTADADGEPPSAGAHAQADPTRWHSGELELLSCCRSTEQLVRRIARRLPPAWFDAESWRAARGFGSSAGQGRLLGWPAAARARTGRRGAARPADRATLLALGKPSRS